MNRTFSIRPAHWHQDREQLCLVRETVFVLEQGVPLALEWDSADETAWHWLAEDRGGRAIGTGRLLPSGQIGRMAVMNEWRRQGVGRALLQAIIDASHALAGPAPFLHAQHGAVEFYRRFGFRPEGETFMDAGIPHLTMRLEPACAEQDA